MTTFFFENIFRNFSGKQIVNKYFAVLSSNDAIFRYKNNEKPYYRKGFCIIFFVLSLLCCYERPPQKKIKEKIIKEVNLPTDLKKNCISKIKQFAVSPFVPYHCPVYKRFFDLQRCLHDSEQVIGCLTISKLLKGVLTCTECCHMSDYIKVVPAKIFIA